jgi:hypothetical protein
MSTLHIEHAITDFDTWLAAFGRLAGVRQQSGVRQVRVLRPADDPRYVSLDLDFEQPGQAEAFLTFLQDKVWRSAESAPALAGKPHTRILDLVEAG